MIYRPFRFAMWVACAVLLLGEPTPTNAQSLPALPTGEQLKLKALEFEKAGNWESALHLWLELQSRDRGNLEIRERLRVCVRHFLQQQRILDDTMKEKVLSLNYTQALSLYGEALSKLHMFYVDRSKVSPGRLFQQGIEELIAGLDSPNFREAYLKNTPDSKISQFREELRRNWSDKEPSTIRHAQELVRDLTTKAQKELKFSKSNIVIVEMIAGACNSLDEYSAYVTPAQLTAESASESQSSVTDVGFARDGIGYFRITRFKEATPKEVDAALTSLRMNDGMMGMGARAIIMDLRGNPGGSFTAAVQVAERFISAGVLATTQGQSQDVNRTFQATGGPNVTDLPLIVLTDVGTASAAEALAAALRDQNRATLIGTTTFGKGAIQRVVTFSTAEETDAEGKVKQRSGGVRITLARFYAPNGQSVNGAGIVPHIAELDKTRQLEAAVEYAGRFVSAMMMR